jgi:hypothetical protein
MYVVYTRQTLTNCNPAHDRIITLCIILIEDDNAAGGASANRGMKGGVVGATLRESGEIVDQRDYLKDHWYA